MQAWIFGYRPQKLRMISRPVLQLFGDQHFVFRPSGTTFDEPLAFEWRPLDATLPPLRGEIRLHRVGPWVLIIVRARFYIAADVVGRLLSESVGRKCARASLRFLRRALARVISGPHQSRVRSDSCAHS